MARLLRSLADESVGTDGSQIQSAWTELESLLTRHLEAEEHYLLPLIEAAHRENASLIRDDHDRIRAELAALGRELERPSQRQRGAVLLQQMLEEHAKREESTLYSWVDYSASAAVRRRVLSALRLVSLAAARVRRRFDSVRPVRNSEPPRSSQRQ
jgi:hemerythrin-like domain-containing protein